MNENDKMILRFVAFIMGASLMLIMIFSASERRGGRLLDCSLGGVNCGTRVHKIH